MQISLFFYPENVCQILRKAYRFGICMICKQCFWGSELGNEDYWVWCHIFFFVFQNGTA